MAQLVHSIHIWSEEEVKGHVPSPFNPKHSYDGLFSVLKGRIGFFLLFLH